MAEFVNKGRGFSAPTFFNFPENFKTMKNTDTYTLFTIRFQKAENRNDKWHCGAVLPVTTGLTLKQAAETAGWIYGYERDIPDADGEPWEETVIACIVRDGCTLPKPELVNPTTFAYWEKHHHHLVQTGEIRR